MRGTVNADTAPAAQLSTSDRSGRAGTTPFKGPFKGKGAGDAGNDLRALRGALEAIEREMRQLKQRCLKVDPRVRPFYLDVVQRRARRAPAHTLRWRHRSGRHSTWACVAAAIDALAPPIRAVFEGFNDEAVRLNARAAALRRQWRDRTTDG